MNFFDFNRDGKVNLADHFLAYETFFADATDDEQHKVDAECDAGLDEEETAEDDW